MLPKSIKKQSSEMTNRMADQVLSSSLFTDNDQPMDPDSHQQQAEAKENDPLSSQIWRMYTKAKDTLPNASRVENLTWRMMAMTLKKDNSTSTTTNISEPMLSESEKKDNFTTKSQPMVIYYIFINTHIKNLNMYYICIHIYIL
ncbi:MAG: hypothetical protein EXX96DRAFT_14317 [Benjaminiella poitrasii]|nr:MAG: hypothetical protein EXX96DRAFT_14317 [Benjaminiella poitrasii]